MSQDYQGDLAGLWAVGGKQVAPGGAEGGQRVYRYCPDCGWQMTGRFTTCPRCGADLKTKVCPYCGGVIPVSANECPRCLALTK